MPQSRKLSAHAAAVHAIGKKLLQEFAHVVSARSEQLSLPFFQELGKLRYIRCVGTMESAQPFLDLKVVEKSGEQASIGIGRHEEKFSMRVIGHSGKWLEGIPRVPQSLPFFR